MGHFENRMGQIMLDRGITIEELSEATGRHRNTIANMRKGTPTVRWDTLAAVANVMKVKPWELFVWVEDKN
jgi:DNA-binding Xre family transcriptional regulator